VKAFVTDGHGADLREWPEPILDDGEVLVRPLLVGICGTDLELIDATIDPAYVRYPLVLGHEWVGALVRDEDALGPAGTSVVVEGVIACGECQECRRGATNRCEIYDEIGFTRPGALAAFIGVPRRFVHPLEHDVALEDAVLVEPMAVVWRALTRLPLAGDLNVAIIGDGTIALLAAHLVRLLRPNSVRVFGRRPEQRDLVLEAGADDYETTAPRDLFDLVIEASGSIEGVSSAIDLCARGGMALLLGLPPHGTVLEVAPDDLVNNDVIVQGSFSYTSDAFRDVVDRINAKTLRPSFIITHRFSLDDAGEAVHTLRTGGSKQPRGKIIIEIQTT
jgi:threonine dehydrogenase-like Zn-dependent dehydrogenase